MTTAGTATVRQLERDDLYRSSARGSELVRVPELAFVMVDGRGDPNTSAEYKDAIQALYSLSYTLTFALKKESGLSYRVCPLEGLWWAGPFGARAIGRQIAPTAIGPCSATALVRCRALDTAAVPSTRGPMQPRVVLGG